MKPIGQFFAFLMLFSSVLVAQDRRTSVTIGDQVRFGVTVVGGPLSQASDRQCEGQIFRVIRDTLVVRPFGQCALDSLGLPTIRNLQVARNRGSRGAHLAKGAIFGLIGGGIAGALIAGDGCRVSPCDDGELAVWGFTLAGIVSGAVIGAAVGVLLPTGTHWISIGPRAARFDTR